MNVLLIIAHGSRSREANNEVARLTKNLSANAGTAFNRVVHAYLEIADPRVNDTIAALAQEGAVRITVFPYFLAGGTHVANDIPACITAAKQTYPNICFEIRPHLGAVEGIASLILRSVDR